MPTSAPISVEQDSLSRLPDEFPHPEAVEWGEDDYGLFQVLDIAGVEHGFRWVPPGQFQMGSPDHEQGRFEEEVLHWVTISQGFWLGETTVTNELWQAVMTHTEETRPPPANKSQHPKTKISWHNCQAFCQAAQSALHGLPCRLPTEAEWEYACRAGTQTPFWFGNEFSLDLDKANYTGQWKYDSKSPFVEGAVKGDCAVRSYAANPLGLFEMHGNVWEWCHDWYAEYEEHPETAVDPEGPPDGAERVLRGGSWSSYGRDLRCANRYGVEPDFRDDYFGFRLALGRELRSAASETKAEP